MFGEVCHFAVECSSGRIGCRLGLLVGELVAVCCCGLGIGRRGRRGSLGLVICGFRLRSLLGN